MRKQQGPDGFTLIELLAVVVIIGLAFGIAVAALPGLTRGSAMRASATELRSTLGLARQWAVTQRETTHVVFVDDSPDFSAGGNNRMALAGERAYRGYIVVGSKTGIVSDWKFLKTGIYFLPSKAKESDIGTNYSLDGKNPFQIGSSQKVSIAFPEASDSNTELLPAIGFKPDGGLTTGATPMEVYISEGYMTGPVGLDDVDDSHLKFRPNGAITGFQIMALTGMTRVRTYGEE